MSVRLFNIAIDGVHLGIYSQERAQTQPIVVHLRLMMDVRAVAGADVIESTADYAAVVGDAHRISRKRHFDLLESLVMTLAQDLLRAHPTVLVADVEVEKIRAPVSAKVSARWQACRCVLSGP